MFIDYVQMKFFDPVLIRVLFSYEEEFGEGVFTSLFRMNDRGVHGTLPLRGADVREQNKLVGRIKEDWINSMWQYDSERPNRQCCIFHDAGNGWHLHIQVHPNTQRR